MRMLGILQPCIMLMHLPLSPFWGALDCIVPILLHLSSSLSFHGLPLRHIASGNCVRVRDLQPVERPVEGFQVQAVRHLGRTLPLLHLHPFLLITPQHFPPSPLHPNDELHVHHTINTFCHYTVIVTPPPLHTARHALLHIRPQ